MTDTVDEEDDMREGEALLELLPLVVPEPELELELVIFIQGWLRMFSMEGLSSGR